MILCVWLGFVSQALADEAERQYALAAGLYSRGRWEMASDEFRRLLDEHPQHVRVRSSRFYLGEAEMQLGQYAAAEADFAAFLKADPTSPRVEAARFRQAEAIYLSGRYAEAIPLLRAASQANDPARNVLRCVYVGDAYLRLDDPHEALDWFVRAEEFALAATPPIVAPFAGKFGLAKSLFRVQRYGDAKVALLALPSDPKHSAEIRYWLGLTYLALHENDAAGGVLSKVADDSKGHRLQPAMRYYAGVAQRSAGDVDAARASFAAVRRDSSDGRWGELALEGELFAAVAASDWDAAEKTAKEFLTARPEGPRAESVRKALEHVAEEAYDKHDFTRAARLFTELARPGLAPEEKATLTLALAWCRWEQGQLEEAAVALEPLIASGTGTATREIIDEAGLLLGQIDERRGRPAAAIVTFERVAERTPATRETVAARLSLARVHEQLGEMQPAAAEYAKLIADHDELAPLGATLPEQDELLYRLAWLLTDLGRKDESEECFRRIYDEHVQSRYRQDAGYRLAERAYQAGEFAKAEELLLSLDSESSSPEFIERTTGLAALCAAGKREWPEAVDRLTNWLELYPSSSLAPQAEYWLAESVRELGRTDEALARWERVAVARTSSPDLAAQAGLREAQLHLRLKNHIESERIARRTIERHPEYEKLFEVHYVLGRSLAAKGDFAEARIALRRVVESPIGGRSETAAQAQWLIGETYFLQQNFDQALRDYRRVVDDFDFPQWRAIALLQSGKCSERLRRWSAAIECYEQSLRSGPSEAVADEARDRIAQVRPLLESSR